MQKPRIKTTTALHGKHHDDDQRLMTVTTVTFSNPCSWCLKTSLIRGWRLILSIK